MPYLFYIGCVIVAITAIAALTAIGLYSVVAGGVLFGSPSPCPTPVAAPVLVTIQAAPVTPTLVPIPTSTPMPSSLLPGLGQLGLALAPPSTASPSPHVVTIPVVAPHPATPSPGTAGSALIPPATVPTPPARQAVNDGLTAPWSKPRHRPLYAFPLYQRKTGPRRGVEIS